jgi:hypothetical protein
MTNPVPIGLPSARHDLSGLIRSHDRKVAHTFTGAGRSAIANAFGLPAGREWTCAGETSECKAVCYAGRLEQAYAGTLLPVLMHNYNMLNGQSERRMRELLARMVAEYVEECDRKDVPVGERKFRIHWDGDFGIMSNTENATSYPAAWARVIEANPRVRFWAYSRMANAVGYLHAAHLRNLSLYFSADKENIETAQWLQVRGIRLAYLDETMADGRAAIGSGVYCPENLGRLPMTGACVACGACIRGRSNVLFSSKRKVSA